MPTTKKRPCPVCRGCEKPIAHGQMRYFNEGRTINYHKHCYEVMRAIIEQDEAEAAFQRAIGNEEYDLEE